MSTVLAQVLALRGRTLTVYQLPLMTDEGDTLEYDGTIKLYVRDHVPSDKIEILTNEPMRNKRGQLTRVYATPEDILACRTVKN